MRNAIKKQPIKRENTRRLQVLKTLLNQRPLTKKDCRDLGDAYFAFFAPESTDILTTNRRDHEPLAGALGKRVVCPPCK
jgi:hypothetical protein